MDFRVDLEVFRGPLDLLLYLVRKHEVDVLDLPIAPIAEQYALYLDVLRELDVNAAGDFLEMASTLAEIKSRMVLPRAGEEEEEALDDPRQELVRQLLEYKKFKDAASMLDERSRGWQQRYARLSDDLGSFERNLAEEPLGEIELWDLVSALGRLLREHQATQGPNIVYDETPIHVYIGRIHRRLLEEGPLPFSTLFQSGMHKSSLIGMFLAVLELARHHGVRAEQNELFGEIWLLPGEPGEDGLDLSMVDEYQHPGSPGDDTPHAPR